MLGLLIIYILWLVGLFCSIIGVVVIFLGFYVVMWGKVIEEIFEDFVFIDLELFLEKIFLFRSLKEDNI